MPRGVDIARAMGNKEHADAIEAMKEQLLIILVGRLGGHVKVTVGEVDTGTIGKALEMRLDPETQTFEFGVKLLNEPLAPLKPAEPVPPVDRSQQQLTDGKPVSEDHREIGPDGMQKGYVVLTPEERAKGFVRPVRDAYKHLTCGQVTTMGRALAETYARDPAFYSGTFCATCRKHFPVGPDGEFVWSGTNEKVGT